MSYPNDPKEPTLIETEVRLAIPPQHFDAAVGVFEARHAVVESNRTTYFDTAEHDLWQAGFECRIRENDRGAKQTIKSRSGAGAFRRTELEAVLKQPVLDAAHLQAALPKRMTKAIAFESLAGIFATEVTRRRVEIKAGESVIEAALDDGRIQFAETCRAFREVEFELVRGSFSDLAGVVEWFIAEIPCGIQLAGKAERGYALAGAQREHHVRADRPRIGRAEKLPQAIRTVFTNALTHVTANQSGVVAGDSEAIHQMRVGLRRLRSAATSFAPVLDLSTTQGAFDEAARLFGRLGDIRDDDVFLESTLPLIPDRAFAADQRDALVAAISTHRQIVHDDVREHLTSPAFVRWLLLLERWIDDGQWLRSDRPLDRLLLNRPVGDFAANRTRRLWKRLRRSGAIALDGSVDDWHEVRKRLKKVRYSNEYLIDVAEHDAAHRKARRRSIRKLQGHLGRFNDVAMVPEILERVMREIPTAKRSTLAIAAANRAIGWSAAGVDARVEELGSAWTAFKAATPR